MGDSIGEHGRGYYGDTRTRSLDHGSHEQLLGLCWV